MRILIVDTETTDKDEPEVIELAWQELDSNFNRIDSDFLQRYQPKGAIKFGAMATHHILPEELVGCPPSDTAALPSDTTYIIGHNVDFDWKALGQPPVKRICTLALAKRLWPHCDSYSLGALTYFFAAAEDEKSVTKQALKLARAVLKEAHSAGADVGICNLLLKRILKEVGPHSAEALWLLSEASKIPQVMGFGKYKGKPIKEVPKDYVRWYRNQSDPDIYYLQAFKDAGL